jgi:hypothetical protein
MRVTFQVSEKYKEVLDRARKIPRCFPNCVDDCGFTHIKDPSCPRSEMVIGAVRQDAAGRFESAPLVKFSAVQE